MKNYRYEFYYEVGGAPDDVANDATAIGTPTILEALN